MTNPLLGPHRSGFHRSGFRRTLRTAWHRVHRIRGARDGDANSRPGGPGETRATCRRRRGPGKQTMKNKGFHIPNTMFFFFLRKTRCLMGHVGPLVRSIVRFFAPLRCDCSCLCDVLLSRSEARSVAVGTPANSVSLGRGDGDPREVSEGCDTRSTRELSRGMFLLSQSLLDGKKDHKALSSQADGASMAERLLIMT